MRGTAWISLNLGLLLALSRLGSAAEAHAKDAVVFVNSVPVLELKSGHDRQELDKRAASIARSLRFAGADDEVSVKTSGASAIVKVGTSTSIAVSDEEAQSHQVSATRLATKWADAIRDALNLPTLKFGDDSERLPTSSSKIASLVGSLAMDAVVTSSDDHVVTVKHIDGAIVLSALGVGDAQIVAESGNSQRRLNVSVRPYAAVLPQSLIVEVAGTPASASLVNDAVAGALRTRVTHIQGARAGFAAIHTEQLAEGKQASYDAWVRVRANESFDGVGTVHVTVRNVALPDVRDTALWYSNNPEDVTQTGNLFTSFLKPGESVRFLYHHINGASQPLIFRVEAVNTSETTARLALRPADSKPNQNPVAAGVSVARQFLSSLASNSSEVVSIPPHSTLPIAFRMLSPKDTTSGLCTLRLIDGPSELQIRTEALPPFDLSPEWYNATFTAAPWREAGVHAINSFDAGAYEPSDHIYPNPYKSEEIRYRVGDRFAVATIGQKPIAGVDHSRNLDGNYGVLYSFKAVLENPTSSSADVELLFESSAGYTAGLFLVDGELVQTPYLGPKGQSQVRKWRLGPGVTRTIDIETLPVSGGAYPATLTFRPALGDK
ncbi:MAG: hypothetical protein P4L46_23485 [Fimbriimonas sp.]|nr:hypothetical protein [Fimbriimonas sp.]